VTSENGSRLARELAAQTPASEYDAVAEKYERLVAPRFAVVAARLANIAALRPGERVLELGAGTGALSRLIAPRLEPDGRLVLLDVSSRMLQVAARVLRKAGSRNVTCVSHDMSALPFADEDFDMVLSHMGYFEESQKAAHEAFRVLRPRGRIAIAVWGPLTRHREWRLVRRARAAAGVRGQWVPTVGEAMGRLAKAGFVGLTSREAQFEHQFEGVDAYLEYRQSFPLSVLSSEIARSRYFATLRRDAQRCTRQDGSLAIGWTATFIVGRRAASAG
jgi:ubiquinone/menaquinone biosynthesis C-methylase UbiE